MKRIGQFEDLVGATLSMVDVDEESVVFTLDDGRRFRLFHLDSCCERVTVEDVVGEIGDLVGSPIVRAEESSSSSEHPPDIEDRHDESFTWTFYRIETAKGLIRFYGSSNGYYSEAVSFEEVAA